METGLVSICSPCYNVAPYIPRFLDSLLAQTYKRLEIILVNDGATDETGAVIEAYIPRLEAAGYKVLYLVQENGGQASAINRALKEVHGEFLAWPDPDDWLTPDSIERRVSFLRSHPEAALVRGNVEKIRAEDGQSLGTFEPATGEPCEIRDFAQKLLLLRTWYAPVTTMVRMSSFLKVNPRREIYVSRGGGQNLQLMLPVAFRFSCWQLRGVLGYYLLREESHSHGLRTLEEKLAYIEERRKVFLNTLRDLPEMERIHAAEVRRYNGLQCYELALQDGRGELARHYVAEMGVNPLYAALLRAFTRFPYRLYACAVAAASLPRRGVCKLRRLLRGGGVHTC